MVHVCWGVTVEMTWERHDKHWDKSNEGAGTVRFHHNEPMDKPTNIQQLPPLVSRISIQISCHGAVSDCGSSSRLPHRSLMTRLSAKPCKHLKKSSSINIQLTNTLRGQAQCQLTMKMSLLAPERDPEVLSHGNDCGNSIARRE